MSKLLHRLESSQEIDPQPRRDLKVPPMISVSSYRSLPPDKDVVETGESAKKYILESLNFSLR